MIKFCKHGDTGIRKTYDTGSFKKQKDDYEAWNRRANYAEIH